MGTEMGTEIGTKPGAEMGTDREEIGWRCSHAVEKPIFDFPEKSKIR